MAHPMDALWWLKREMQTRCEYYMCIVCGLKNSLIRSLWLNRSQMYHITLIYVRLDSHCRVVLQFPQKMKSTVFDAHPIHGTQNLSSLLAFVFALSSFLYYSMLPRNRKEKEKEEERTGKKEKKVKFIIVIIFFSPGFALDGVCKFRVIHSPNCVLLFHMNIFCYSKHFAHSSSIRFFFALCLRLFYLLLLPLPLLILESRQVWPMNTNNATKNLWNKKKNDWKNLHVNMYV